MRRSRLIALAIALAICVTAVSVALATSSKPANSPSKSHSKATPLSRAHPARSSSLKARSSARVHSVKVRMARRATASSPRENTPSDPDNVQQGDQTSAEDNPGAAATESETNGESAGDIAEAGQPGEPPAGQGHADSGPDVNHECTGDCQE